MTQLLRGREGGEVGQFALAILYDRLFASARKWHAAFGMMLDMRIPETSNKEVPSGPAVEPAHGAPGPRAAAAQELAVDDEKAKREEDELEEQEDKASEANSYEDDRFVTSGADEDESGEPLKEEDEDVGNWTTWEEVLRLGGQAEALFEGMRAMMRRPEFREPEFVREKWYAGLRSKRVDEELDRVMENFGETSTDMRDFWGFFHRVVV